ncbi:MAG: acyltransferase [Candidatus Margulisbacteria bacterium]|nr:acyltransferase [Candidatus Margulisiibacteriota bacterium]
MSKNTILNENPNFNGMIIKGRGEVYIGNNFHSGEGCLIITSYHNYDKGKSLPYDDTMINKDVFIGDNVWLGDRVIILGGIKIGEGAIIQAGAVVIRDVPDLAIVGGNPAAIFKYRDKEHYYSLKPINCNFD